MKKILSALCLAAVVAIGCYALISQKDAIFGNTDAHASCSVVRKGKVIFECTGEDGTCSTTYMGITLTCSGKIKEEPGLPGSETID